MVGKNNKSVRIQKSAVRRPQYALKKLSVGVVSVAVGSLLSLGVTSVQAEEITNDNTILVDIETTENASNLEHISDDIVVLDESVNIEVNIPNQTENSWNESSFDSNSISSEIFTADIVESSGEETSEVNEVVLDTPPPLNGSQSSEQVIASQAPSVLSELDHLESTPAETESVISPASSELSDSVYNFTFESESFTADIVESPGEETSEVNEVVLDTLPALNESQSSEQVIASQAPSILSELDHLESTPAETESIISPASSELSDSVYNFTSEIVDFQLEKRDDNVFIGSELIKAQLIVKDSRGIAGAYLSYSNTTSAEYFSPDRSDVTYMQSDLIDSSRHDRVKMNEDGNYVIDFILNEDVDFSYTSFAPGEYKLSLVLLFNDIATAFTDDGTLLDSSFIYKQTEDQELIKAESEEIPFDFYYTHYEEEVRDGVNGITYYYADGFHHTVNPISQVILRDHVDVSTDYGISYIPNYDLDPGMENILQEGKNGIARRFYNAEGKLIDEVYPVYSTQKIIEYGISKDAELEENRASIYSKSNITILDINTGHEITAVTFNGESYYHRLEEFVTKYNNRFGTSLSAEYEDFISTNDKAEIINGQYVAHRNVNYFVSNSSEIDTRDHDFDLIPEWSIHYKDDEFISGQLSIREDKNQLFNFDFSDYINVNDLVKKSLLLLDSSLYYFDNATIETGLWSNNYKIDILVRERLTKSLAEANYTIDYTNSPSKVRSGQTGTKYIYSDGSERFDNAPINEVKLSETILDEKPVVDTITVDRDTYAIDEKVEVTITGRSQSAIKDLVIQFSDWSVMKTFYLEGRMSQEDFSFEDGKFTTKLLVNINKGFNDSNFTFDNLHIKDIYDIENQYWTDVTFNSEELSHTIINEPFKVGFQTTNNTLLGVDAIPYKIEFTTDKSFVRVGQNGSKWVYSDGSEAILTEAISEIVLYDNEIVEIEPETEYTIYAHEVRAGINGSKLVFVNGEEKVMTDPTSAIALYRNNVETFDFTTVRVESSDIPFGERKVLQEGILGRRAVFYDADGKTVDSLVVSAPVSRIEQVGANKQTLVLTPFDVEFTSDEKAVRTGQNGTKYIYSDGREELVTKAVSTVQLYRYADEAVTYNEVVNKNPLMAIGESKFVSKGSNGLNRVFYDQDGKIIEVRSIVKVIDQIVEIGTLVEFVEDEETIIPGQPQPDLDGGSSGIEPPVTEDDSSENEIPATEDDNSIELNPVDREPGNSPEDENSEVVDSKSDSDDIEPDKSADNKILDLISPTTTVNYSSVLPSTGENDQQIWLTLGALALISGLGLVINSTRKREE